MELINLVNKFNDLTNQRLVLLKRSDIGSSFSPGLLILKIQLIDSKTGDLKCEKSETSFDKNYELLEYEVVDYLFDELLKFNNENI